MLIHGYSRCFPQYMCLDLQVNNKSNWQRVAYLFFQFDIIIIPVRIISFKLRVVFARLRAWLVFIVFKGNFSKKTFPRDENTFYVLSWFELVRFYLFGRILKWKNIVIYFANRNRPLYSIWLVESILLAFWLVNGIGANIENFAKLLEIDCFSRENLSLLVNFYHYIRVFTPVKKGIWAWQRILPTSQTYLIAKSGFVAILVRKTCLSGQNITSMQTHLKIRIALLIHQIRQKG
jgi:hypothetical protein